MSQKQNNNPPPPTLGMAFTEEVSPPPPSTRPPIRQTLTQSAYMFLNGLYTRPNDADMVIFVPDTLTVAIPPFYYPSPTVQVKPITFYTVVGTAPTGSNITIEIYRSALTATASNPGIPGAKMADIVITAGSNDGLATYVDDDNFLVPGTNWFPSITAVGSGTAGANLWILARG